jgi:hypothetical protein
MIESDPQEAARLRRSRQQVREGEVHWGLIDGEECIDYREPRQAA